MDEKQNFFDGNYSYIFSSNVHIFLNLLDNFFQKNVNFSQKSSESLASNLRRFFDIWKWTEYEDEDGSLEKNLRRSKIFEASLQLCYVSITLGHDPILACKNPDLS